ncbi:zinc finger protein 184-like isoform X1 [Ischnura elegans]|uniref:zinc finger protein 184-like isoform X1 n=1 Tax=Ischnura elegans TaxID=197161 RepID=UPI001ED87562|nr:zinc finger protein 184-like isoform X1 [Ischnura elegans]
MALTESLQICRTCVLKSPRMLGIFGEGALGCSIADLINELLDLNVRQGDGLPDRICCNCLNELARFKKFKNISHEAKITLEYILKRENAVAVPQALQSIKDKKEDDSEDVPIVDLQDSSDDDSGAETVCAPSSPTYSVSSDDIASVCCFDDEDEDNDKDVEVISEPSTSVAAYSEAHSAPEEVTNNMCIPNEVFIPLESTEEELEEEESAMDCEDPLSIKINAIKAESGDPEIRVSDSENELVVDDVDVPADFLLMGQCSRTLPWITKKGIAVTEPSTKYEVPGVKEDSLQVSSPHQNKQNEESGNWNQMGRKCSLCSLKFKNSNELKEHMSRKDCFVMKCSFCNTLLLKAQLQAHLKYCVDKPLPYVCRVCGKSFLHQTSLAGHQGVHVGKNRENQCFLCGVAFKSMQKLKEHRKLCSSFAASQGVEPDFPIYRCGECSSAYTKPASLKRHLNLMRHKVCLCGDCGVSCPSFTGLCQHFLGTHENWCFSCRKCGKKFVEQGRCDLHVMKCTNNNVFKCGRCKLSFQSKSKYDDHLKKAH